jgi:hypothetical protein
VTTNLYGSVMAALSGAAINWGSGSGGDTINVALLSSGYTPNLDTHNYFDDVSANQVTGTGYTAGGVTLTGKTVSYDPGPNATTYNADDAVWATVTVTGVRYAVVYKSTGVAASSPLIALVDFGSDQAATAEPFVVSWDVLGIFTLALAASPSLAEAAQSAAEAAAAAAASSVASIWIDVAAYPSAVAAVAAAGDGDTVHFPPGVYVNPAGIGNGITVLADNVVLDFSPGVEIQVPTWGQCGIDAFDRSGVVVRGTPTIRYTGTRGTHASIASHRGSAGYVNTAGFYSNRDRCVVESMRTIGMVCGVFFSSFDGTSSVDRMGVGNVIGRLECEDYNFGVLWVGQDGMRIDDLYCHDDLDDSSGANPTHAYYSSATTSFRARNITIAKAICENNVSGQAFQLKFCDSTKLGPHTATGCRGLLNVIDCVDLDAPSLTGVASLPSTGSPHGAITCQGSDSLRLKIKATVVQDTVTGVDQRAIMAIADDSEFDFTVVSNRTSGGSAGTPEINVRGANNKVSVDVTNVSAYPAVAVSIGDGTIDSSNTEVRLRRIDNCVRGVDWLGPASGTVHLTRDHVSLTSSALTSVQAGSPSFKVFEDGVLTGAGTPEGVVTAAVGALFKRTDGAAGTVLYAKETGSGNTGWRAMVSGTPVDVQEFTTSGTWTKPAGARTVEVLVIGAGCGGGSGRRGASGTVCGGGGGGAAGPMLRRVFDASDLAGTESVVVSAGGVGGATVTANDTNGNVGDYPASATYFGTLNTKRVYAGQGFSTSRGQAGTTTGGAGGISPYTATALSQMSGGVAGGTGAAGGSANPSLVGPAGGAGGGGVSATPAAFAGGAGGYSALAESTGGGTGGVVDSTAPTAGTAPGGKGSPGQSAGGGASSITTAAQAGAAATGYGAGGAGGGASLNGNDSGAGGAGGPGYVLVLTTF